MIFADDIVMTGHYNNINLIQVLTGDAWVGVRDPIDGPHNILYIGN